MIARTIAKSPALVPGPRTNPLSILSMSTGRGLRCDSIACPVPKSSMAIWTRTSLSAARVLRVAFDMVHHGALSDLQADRSPVDAELIDGLGDLVHKTASDQLHRRHVDAQYCAVSHAVGAPAAEFGAGASHHPPAHLPGEGGRFGHADKRIRQSSPGSGAASASAPTTAPVNKSTSGR
jgi:hypothetical protein